MPVKKAKTPKEKKPHVPKAHATHPPYLEMIVEAITALKKRTRSSQFIIAKYLESKYTTGQLQEDAVCAAEAIDQKK